MTSAVAMRLLAVAFLALASAEKVSPVQKVLSLIDEMTTKSTGHIKQSVADFEHFAVFCDGTARDKEYSLKTSADAIASLEAVIEKSHANIGQNDAEITDLSTSIASTNGEIHKANILREKDHADFLALEKELSEAVETLAKFGQAGAASLAQLTQDEHRQIEAVEGTLRSVVEAGYVTHETRAKVASFLEEKDDANDDLETGAKAEKAEGQGDTLGRVKDLAMGSLSDTRKNEQNAQFEHSTATMHLEGEVKSFEKEMASAQQNKQFNRQSLAQAEKDLSVEKKNRGEDSKFMDDLKMDCASKFQDFEADYKEAQAELKALAQAKAILVQGVKASFLETHASLRSSSHMATQSSDPDGKTRALRAIQQLGKRLKVSALVSLSYRAAADPFGKVREMVVDMINKLEQQAAEEATQENFCKEEQAKTLKSKEDKEMTLEKADSRIEKSQSSIARLSEDVAALSKEIAELDAETAEATAIRRQEKASFTTSEGEFLSSVAACNQAISVLQANAEGATSLLQRGAISKRSAAATQTKLGVKGVDGILQMLRYAESDFAEQLAGARSAESMAVSEYERLIAEGRQVKAMKETEVKGKQSESMSLKDALASYTEDHDGVSTELSAVTGYLAELKPKCEAAAPPSYAARKAKRQQEIEGLKDALKLLEQ